MAAQRLPARLIRRPVRAFLLLGSGLFAWTCIFAPFVEDVAPLKIILFGGFYSVALSGIVIGVVLQTGSRLYWAWISLQVVLIVCIGSVLAIYGLSLEFASSGAVPWLLAGIHLFLACTGIVAVKGWLTLWTRKTSPSS